jgi:hypothetical protein
VTVDSSNTVELNNIFDTFLVGSDQVWNYNLSLKRQRYFLLDFSQDNKKRIAYSSSFGNSVTLDEDEDILRYLFSKFDFISLRENYIVPEFNEKVGIDVKQVLDPVFVCDNSVYSELIEQSNLKVESGYIFAYILDGNEEKNKILDYVSKVLNKRLIICTDATLNKKKRRIFNCGEVVGEIDLQDWLKYYKCADYVITDSFHGSCFSIIFKKQFVSIGNIERGIKRFISMLSGFNLIDRMVLDLEDVKNTHILENDIDYEKVYEIIKAEQEQSYNWLKSALETKKENIISDYDVTRKLISLYSKPKIYYTLKYYAYKFAYKLSFGKCHKRFKSKSLYWHEKLKEYRKSKGFI